MKPGWFKFIFIFCSILGLLFGLLPGPAEAQEEPGGGAVYIVQEGDYLSDIARRFGVSTDEIISLNGITNPNQLNVGTELRIPGLDWIDGKLVTETIGFGESFRSIARKLGTEPDLLARLNRITSPNELYTGASLIFVENGKPPASGGRVTLAPGQSFLELSASHGLNPWQLSAGNAVSSSASVLPGEVLRLPGEGNTGPSALPGAVESVNITPLPLMQGEAAVITLAADPGLTASGQFGEYPLSFYPYNGEYIAVQGVHAMLEPGLYPLAISGSLPDGTPFGFTQNVFVRADQFVYDVPLTVAEETIDPAVTKPEDQQWKALTAPQTPEKLWDGKWILPSNLFTQAWCLETLECFSSRFGNRRSYNGSDYDFYHTGLDLFGGVGIDILAPAAGEVVFSGFLTVRGNATVINHGWGVYSAYMHQSEMLVKQGDTVVPGQVIGKIGGTGRVQGPHLHWEILVGGIPVDPLDWLAQEYP